MPVPKRRKSRSTTRHRKAQWKLSVPGRSTCPQCHAPKASHRVCGNCGYYDGREVVEVE
ncbi:MAG TPA: 50S ribosomal protein L32 [Actinomycetota bacterium]|nr:50S ribosomal protein L32 [Actinomycetota bacterium]